MNRLAGGLSYPQDIHSPYAYNLGDKNIHPKMLFWGNYMRRTKTENSKKYFVNKNNPRPSIIFMFNITT